MHLAEKLTQVIKGDVRTDEDVLFEHSRDASPLEVRPSVVVYPKDSTDVQKLVSFVSKQKKKDPTLSLTARGGGTDSGGGPLNESIIVDFSKYCNTILDVTKERGTAQMGTFYRDFEKETLKQGVLLPSFPQSRELCTLGGMTANNSGGENSLAMGKTENYVEALKVVLSDGKEYSFKKLTRPELKKKMALKTFEGKVYRDMFALVDRNDLVLSEAKPNVSKNSAGYALWNVWDGKTFDLTKLFVGSQGTLGLITEATYRLVPPKKHGKMLVIFLNDISLVPGVINDVLQFKPETFESYDDKVMKLTLAYLPQFVKHLGGNIFSLLWKFMPEFFMVLTKGLPKLVLLAEFTGETEQEAELNATKAQDALRKYNVTTRLTKHTEETRKYKVVRRESFSVLRHKLKDKQTVTFIDDFVVRPEQLPEFLPKIEKILDAHKITYTIIGHIGDANFHIIPLMDLSDPKTPKIIEEVTKQVYDVVIDFHGSITGEHNDGLIRSPFLEQMYGRKVYRLFEQTKKIFDPDNIFNPGKKVHADFNYTLRHLKKGQ